MLCIYGRIFGYLHTWVWICMHGVFMHSFGFASAVLDLHAWFGFACTVFTDLLLFWDLYRGILF